MEESESNLVWKIAGGVVLGGLILSGVQAYRERIAIAEANRQIAEFASQVQKQSQQAQREFAASREAERQVQARRTQAELESRQLAPEQRCIGKDLFNRVNNGWVQVIDGSANLKCKR